MSERENLDTHIADYLEQGNGYPTDGSIVATDDGEAYEVTGSRGPIRTRQFHPNACTLTLVRAPDRDDEIDDDTPLVDVRPAVLSRPDGPDGGAC